MSEPIDILDQATSDLRKQCLKTLGRVPDHGREALICTFVQNYLAMAIIFLGRERAREIFQSVCADLGIPLTSRRGGHGR